MWLDWPKFKAFIAGSSVVLLDICLDTGVSCDSGGYFVFSEGWLGGKRAGMGAVPAAERKL